MRSPDNGLNTPSLARFASTRGSHSQVTPEFWADLRNNAAAFQCYSCQMYPQVCDKTWVVAVHSFTRAQQQRSGAAAATGVDDNDDEEAVQPLPMDVDVDALLEEEQRRSGHPVRPLISVVPSGALRDSP